MKPLLLFKVRHRSTAFLGLIEKSGFGRFAVMDGGLGVGGAFFMETTECTELTEE